jgi:flagellar protein FlaG
MDMSVKLNLSYPAVAPPGSITPKQFVAQPEAETLVKPVKKPERAELEQAVQDIQAFVQSSQRNLDFSIDDSTGKVVVKVIATESGEVIRQLPTEAALKLAQSLSDASNLLFNTKA